jgi:hypothetical protein
MPCLRTRAQHTATSVNAAGTFRGTPREFLAALEAEPGPTAAAAAGDMQSDPGSVTLRAPGTDPDHSRPLPILVDAGQRQHALALVATTVASSTHYEISVPSLPDGWWSAFPNPVYLVPWSAWRTVTRARSRVTQDHGGWARGANRLPSGCH